MNEGEKLSLSESGDNAISGVKADVRRRSALGMLQMVYRLVKACLLHSDSNQAVLSLVPAAIDSVVTFCELSGTSAATVVFAGNTIFVNGQMLRASRETYELAIELGSFFETCDVSELVLDKAVRRAELAAFARLIADAQRDRGIAARLIQSSLRGIRVRKLSGPFPAGSIEGEGTRVGRVSRTYAAAILVMRSFYAALRSGDPSQPQRVKRVAQKLVAVAEEDARPLLSLAAGKVADPDEAGMSVSTAIVALGIARQLTSDRRMLGSLVTAALLYDLAKLRLLDAVASGAGREDRGDVSLIERGLTEDEKGRLPASAAVMLTALGKLHAPSILRTVITYEALALRAGARQGALYGGRRSPTVLARILAAARTFTELRAASRDARGGSGGSPLDEVIQRMLAEVESATERSIVKLLIGALGLFPTGTFVLLSTGERAVVLATPALPAHFAQPPVRVLFDEQGQLLDAPFDVDLSVRTPGAEPRFIVRVLEVEPQYERAIRASLGPRAMRGAGVLEPRAFGDALPRAEDEIPATEPGNTFAPHAPSTLAPYAPHTLAPHAPHTLAPHTLAPHAPSTLAPRTPHTLASHAGPPSRVIEERARPASSRKEAAWLGKPISSSAQVVPPPASAQPRRPVAADRPSSPGPASPRRGRDEDLISTQPPPSAAAVQPPAVPPPPRLPRDSLRPEQMASRYAAPPPSRASARGPELRDSAPGLDHGIGQLPTIGPPPAPTERSRSLDPRNRPSARRPDSRRDPGDLDWDDELPTIDPPPPTSPSPSPSYAPIVTERMAQEAFGAEPPGHGADECDTTWSDELPTLDPPPPSTPEQERDRLLAAYLAERTPFPNLGHHERRAGPSESPGSVAPDSRLVGGPTSAARGPTSSARGPASSHGPASVRGSPVSRVPPPSAPGPLSHSKRPPRAPIPREEPEEDDSSAPAPESRGPR